MSPKHFGAPGGTGMKRLALAGAVLACLVGTVALASSSSSTGAAGPQVVSVIGVGHADGRNVFVHITLVVPPGLDVASAKANALASQHARLAQSADFTTTGLVWSQFTDTALDNDFVIQYYNGSGDPTGNGLGALLAAESVWTNVATSRFSFNAGGTTSRCPSLVTECGNQQFDGYNDVAWVPLSGSNILGVTWYGGQEADVALNTHFTWNAGCQSVANSFDAQTVLTHENGHVAGLGHSSVSGSVMEAVYGGVRCALTADDIAGISSLYPEAGTATPTATSTPSASPTSTPTAGAATPIPTPTASSCPPGQRRKGRC